MLYAIFCYDSEAVTNAWSKEYDDQVMTQLGGVLSKLADQKRLGPTARLMPTTAIPPPALSRSLVGGNTELFMLRALGAFTPLANLCDLPSIAVPCGVDDRGRPLSVMFVAAKNREDDLLRIARAVEETGLGRAPI